MSEHARFSPSAMARIIACPGSVLLSEQAPPAPPSEYAEEGTKAHARAEELLLNFESDIKIDDPDAVDVYVSYVESLLDGHYGIEARLFHDSELFGTIDFWGLRKRRLYMVDYKHGQGVRVAVKGNKQLLTYAGLLLLDESIPVGCNDVDEIVLVIVQPRGQGDFPSVNEWTCSIETVWEHMLEVERARDLALGDNPPVKLGEHCKFCRAKIECPAMLKAAEGVAEWDVRDIEPDKLAQYLIEADALAERSKALFAYAQSRAEAGESIPGWGLYKKQARRKWTDTDAVIKRARRFGLLKKIRPQTVVSPAQADKILSPEQYEHFTGLVVSESSGLTLKQTEGRGAPEETPMAALTALYRRQA